jgi:hypothetical protein
MEREADRSLPCSVQVLNVLPMPLRGMLLNCFNNNNYNLLLHGSYFKVKSVEAIVISRDASRDLSRDHDCSLLMYWNG